MEFRFHALAIKVVGTKRSYGPSAYLRQSVSSSPVPLKNGGFKKTFKAIHRVTVT